MLDGVGDLPHPDLMGKTPLDAASTPNLDRLTKNGRIKDLNKLGRDIKSCLILDSNANNYSNCK